LIKNEALQDLHLMCHNTCYPQLVTSNKNINTWHRSWAVSSICKNWLRYS